MSRACYLILGLALVAAPSSKARAQCSAAYDGQWGTNGCGAGEFDSNRDVAVDDNCTVFTVDHCGRVQVFDALGNFCRMFGEPGSAPYQLVQPYGIAVSGNLVYVANSANHRITVFTKQGVPVNEFGSFGNGPGQFFFPTKVAIDGAGDIYVADYGNHRIQKFTSAGVYLLEWGTPGSGNGQFNRPTGVAVDASGFVYVTESCNYRVQKFTSTGIYVTQWGGLGTGAGEFKHPTDVGVDASGFVYVVEGYDDGCEPTYNNRVQQFTSGGTYVQEWGTQGNGNGQFASPWGIGVVPGTTHGCMFYVADTDNRRIQRFGTPQGCVLECVIVGVERSAWSRVKGMYR